MTTIIELEKKEQAAWAKMRKAEAKAHRLNLAWQQAYRDYADAKHEQRKQLEHESRDTLRVKA